METVAVGMASPTFSTSPSSGGTVGTVVLNDTATVGGGFQPGGSITFSLYSNSACTGTPFYTTSPPITVSGAGEYTTANTTPADAAGTWYWTASFSGDANNNPASSECGVETVAVAKSSPTLATSPSAGGTAGSVVLNDTGTVGGGFQPGGSITFSLYGPGDTSCSGTPVYTTSPPITVSGDGQYTSANTGVANVPGTWNWTVTYSGDGNNNGATSACGSESVTVTGAAIAQGSCAGSGSLSTLVSGSNVTSYVPKGSWTSTATGIDVVNVEGNSITDTFIQTPDVINSCASNSITGQTVCTANNNHVYVLKGTGLDPSVPTNPLTDSGTGVITFSGGSVTTAGVAMDASDNKALVALSIGGVGGYQFLDLGSNPTFEPAIVSQDPNGDISEATLFDPIRQLILSAAEDNNVEAVNVGGPSPQFFEHPVSVKGALDSTAEDCSTGIVISPEEFTTPSQIEIADISNPGTPPNAVFTPGSPGLWTAPEQVQTLSGSSFSSGATGSAVAQGTHTAVISGQSGGDSLTALVLPTTSGAGAVPAMSNWLSCAIGADSSGTTFVMGDDPHTLAAYQSPNGGDAMALLVNQGATEMVKVDLTKMLSLPDTLSANVCDSGTLDSNTESFIPLP